MCDSNFFLAGKAELYKSRSVTSFANDLTAKSGTCCSYTADDKTLQACFARRSTSIFFLSETSLL